MSLYNIVHGMNDKLVIVASVIMGMRIDQTFPRFRDIFIEAEDAPFEADLFVYTRMGGGNRECWDGCSETDPCPACVADGIESEVWCAGSYDDEFDCTYRTFGIKLSDGQRAELTDALRGTKPKNFEDRARKLFNLSDGNQ